MTHRPQPAVHPFDARLAALSGSRRDFLQRLAMGGLILSGGSSLVTGCTTAETVETQPSLGSTPESLPMETSSVTSPPLPPQRFTIPAQAPLTLIPGLGFDQGSMMAILATWSGLYTWEASGAEPVPAAAAGYVTSEDGLTHTITLKSGLTWSDGEPHVAGDYIFGIRYRFERGLLFDPPWLVGVLDLLGGAGFEAIGVTAPDDTTLVFQTTEPIPFFTHWLAGEYNYWPLPPHVLTDQAGEDALNRAAPFVGNGAFVATALDATVLELERNPAFAGPRPNADGLTYRFFPSVGDAATFTAFRAHELDVATLSLADLRNVEADPDLAPRVSIIEWQNPHLVALHHTSGPLGDVRVRQALYAAIDREQIAADLFRGSATPAYQLLGPTYPGHRPERRPVEVSPDRARALLADAGFPGGEGFPRLTYQNLAIPGLVELAQVLQAMWKDVLGIDIEINGVDAATYSERIFGAEGSWGDMSDLVWPEYFHDPADTLYSLYSFGGLYVHTGWQGHDDALQGQQDAALFEPEPLLRDELLAEYDFAVLEQMPFIPVAFINDAQIRGEHIEGSFVNYGTGFTAAFNLTRSA